MKYKLLKIEEMKNPKLKFEDIRNIVFADVNTKDANDFSDAHIEYAEYPDGTPIEDEVLQDLDSELIYELLIENIY